MPRKNGEHRSGQDRRAAPRKGPAASRRTIKREEQTSQLLERGEGPTAEEQIDPDVDSPSEVTNEGGPDSRGMRGTGGEGGYSTLGGDVYPDEGHPEDTPHYGDWQRHSTGATSGARGQEGFGNPGEETWGEEQSRRRADGRRAQRRSDEALGNEIREILTNDPELDAAEVEVEVEDGAVTISGVVDGSDARLLAEELVESVTGVREVHNRLRIER